MRYKNKLVMLLSLMLVLVMSLISAMACDPVKPLHIQNQTDQTLTIFLVFPHRDIVINEGKVAPDGEINIGKKVLNEYYLQAKNAQGNLVFSRTYTRRELIDIDWKVVIPPLED